MFLAIGRVTGLILLSCFILSTGGLLCESVLACVYLRTTLSIASPLPQMTSASSSSTVLRLLNSVYSFRWFGYPEGLLRSCPSLYSSCVFSCWSSSSCHSSASDSSVRSSEADVVISLIYLLSRVIAPCIYILYISSNSIFLTYRGCPLFLCIIFKCSLPNFSRINLNFSLMLLGSSPVGAWLSTVSCSSLSSLGFLMIFIA